MKRYIAIVAFCALTISASAQTMSFLNINPDAGTAGLAGAGVARKADAYVYSNNVAAAALSDRTMAIALGYGKWQPKAADNGLLSASGFYRISDRIAVNANFASFSYKEYTVMSESGRNGGTFTPKEMTFGLGLSYAFTDALAAGVNLKMASSSLASDAKASAFAADIALKYEKDAFNAGLSVNNLGGKVNYGGSDYSLPMLVKGGASYTFYGITAIAELSYLNSGIMAGVGAEYNIKDIAFVRLGYHYGDSEKTIPSYASAGLGLNFAGFEVSAAYLISSGALKSSMFFTLGYSF